MQFCPLSPLLNFGPWRQDSEQWEVKPPAVILSSLKGLDPSPVRPHQLLMPGAVSLQPGPIVLCALKPRLLLGLPAPILIPFVGDLTKPARTTSPSVPDRVVASVRRLHWSPVTMQRVVSMVARLGLRGQPLPSVPGRPLSGSQVG